MKMKQITFYIFNCFLGLQSLYADPSVLSITPNNGIITGGNTVTIWGAEFDDTTNVSFGDISATSFSVVNEYQISAVVPQGLAGTVDVIITAGTKTSHSRPEDFYTYTTTGWNGITSGTSPNQVASFATSTNTFNNFIPLPADSLASVISPDGSRIYTANTILQMVYQLSIQLPTVLSLPFQHL